MLNHSGYTHSTAATETMGFARVTDQFKGLRVLSLRLIQSLLLSSMLIMAMSAFNTLLANDKDKKIIFGTNTVLPVRDHGKRFMAHPMGDISVIKQVARITREHGKLNTIRSAGVYVPNKTHNRTLKRYDYDFHFAGDTVSFSYYEGKGFAALGYHKDGKIVLDVLNSKTPFAGPRLWGACDQVINESHDMQVVMGNGKEDMSGLLNTAYYVGAVADIKKAEQEIFADAYIEGLETARWAIYSGAYMAKL